MSTKADLLGVLQRFWGFRELKPLQDEAMAAILQGRDSLVVLPTGGGKSLCFQAPALLGEEGLALVVSPLISLMKDQVDALAVNGVPAAYFNSSLTLAEQDRVLTNLRQDRYRLLYVSPERLAGDTGPAFRELLRDCALRYVAVDEAHCISQWGHDFRPEYRQLAILKQAFPGISVHAFTATATRRVQRDIAEQLDLEQPELLVGRFDRPNLVYRSRRRQQLRTQLRSILARHSGESGIIYCITRREVETLAEELQKEGHRALPYHAGLANGDRRRHQDAFSKEEVDIVVATVAFGMGIDRSNVRFVIHVGAPRSVEHYQQEAGRAGRDGLEAECTWLFSPADFLRWRRMLESSEEFTDHTRRNLADMERYATQTRCRHRTLCEYFGEPYERQDCGACDWCLGELELVEDPVTLAQKILSCVLRLRESWGMGQVMDVLRGRTTDKVTARGHQDLSTFGLLAELPLAELRGYLEQLLDQGFLTQVGEPYPVLKVTAEGRQLLKAQVPCTFYRQRRPERQSQRRKKAPRDRGSWDGVDRGLFERLRQLRLDIARQRNVSPFVVFHDSVLRDLARWQPSSHEALLEISGIGERKAEDFGPAFLEAIAAYTEEGGKG